MNRIITILTFCVLCCLQSIDLNAQVDAFAVAKLDRSSVYPQQPIKATITVYTATWFTKPLNIQNIQIPNAFVLPFKRTLSSMRTIDRKKYASLEFYYLIFPYEKGTYALPALTIGIETPPEGDYKGIATQLKTKAISYMVKEQPAAFEGDQWFVAKNFYITDNWSKPLDEIKVGDVVERNIRLNAKGTLPNFIPDVNLEGLSFASIYKQSPQITDTRTNQEANGIKTETFLYLFEEEGQFTIPEVRVDWWNPYASRSYFKTIPQIEVEVNANPDLGMLATMQDSLSNANEPNIDAATEDKFFNEEMRDKLVMAVVLIIGLYLFSRLSLYLYQLRKARLAIYRKSEKYAFNQLRSSSRSNLKENIHQWWSVFYVQNELNPSLNHEMCLHGFEIASNELPEMKMLMLFREQILNESKLKRHLSQLQFKLDKA